MRGLAILLGCRPRCAAALAFSALHMAISAVRTAICLSVSAMSAAWQARIWFASALIAGSMCSISDCNSLRVAAEESRYLWSSHLNSRRRSVGATNVSHASIRATAERPQYLRLSGLSSGAQKRSHYLHSPACKRHNSWMQRETEPASSRDTTQGVPTAPSSAMALRPADSCHMSRSYTRHSFAITRAHTRSQLQQLVGTNRGYARGKVRHEQQASATGARGTNGVYLRQHEQ